MLSETLIEVHARHDAVDKRYVASYEVLLILDNEFLMVHSCM